jgi:hypothetical protein
MNDQDPGAIVDAGWRRALRVYVAELRARADKAGPQAYGLTYAFVADEIEERFVRQK